ncbi:MAG: hypothetical protein IKB34_03535 [Clostridia bacterium]|nr:hypothetical protein [Clostridia bacterium]
MELFEFEEIIKRGLGRGVTFLSQARDKSLFRNAVIHLATNDLRFDSQNDPHNGHYINELIDCFPDAVELRREIFEKYLQLFSNEASDQNTEDKSYYISVLSDMAEHGDKEALNTLLHAYSILKDQMLASPNSPQNLYPPIDRLLFDYSYISSLLLDIFFLKPKLTDGVPPKEVEEFAEKLLSDNLDLMLAGDRFDDSDLTEIWKINTRIIDTPLFSSLRSKLSLRSESYEKLLDSHFQAEMAEIELINEITTPQSKKQAHKRTPPKTVEELRSMLSKLPPFAAHTQFKDFFARLTAEDRAHLAEMIETERNKATRSKLIIAVLRNNAIPMDNYPRDPSPLIDELMRHSNLKAPVDSLEKIHVRDLAKLVSKIRHPSVRSYALGRIHKTISNDFNAVIDIFSFNAFLNNYDASSSEDKELVIYLVKRTRDDYTAHNYAHDLLTEKGSHSFIPKDLLTDMILYIYENTVCPSCRTSAALMLLDSPGDNENDHALPANKLSELCLEMLHDSSETVRQAAEKYLSKHKTDT